MPSTRDWCITALASRADTASTFADFQSQIQEAISAHATNIRIEPLSPIHDGTIAAASRLLFSIGADGLSPLRETLHNLADGGRDAIFHPADLHWSKYKLMVLDLDSTLVTCEGIDELAKLMGVGDQVTRITEFAMRGEIDFEHSFRKRIALLRGLEFQRVADFVSGVEVMPGAALLLRTLKSAGYRSAIATGGFDVIAARLQQELGIDDFCANTLDVRDGRLTGEVPTRIIDGAGKAAFVSSVAQKQGIAESEVIVIGDGANDIPMMQGAGLSIAYHGKPKVRAVATCSVSYSALDALLYVLQLDQKGLRALMR